MDLRNTEYSARTGIKIFKYAANDWRHVDTNDASTALDLDLICKRQVGPSYKSKTELLADHVHYLLMGGWLELEIDCPEPEFVTASFAPNTTVYGWAMEDKVIGIRVYGESKKLAFSNFKNAVETEYGKAVTVREGARTSRKGMLLFSGEF